MKDETELQTEIMLTEGLGAPEAAKEAKRRIKVEATARKAVDKAVAQDRKERSATVETLTTGDKLTAGAKRGVVYAVTKSWAIIDWINGEREGWNNKALKRAKARKG